MPGKQKTSIESFVEGFVNASKPHLRAGISGQEIDKEQLLEDLERELGIDND